MNWQKYVEDCQAELREALRNEVKFHTTVELAITKLIDAKLSMALHNQSQSVLFRGEIYS